MRSSMRLDKRYQTITAERIRLCTDFETRLAALRARLAARTSHVGNDIRDVADQGVMALTSLAEFIAAQHVALVKKKGMDADVRDHWLNFVHEEMRVMYDLCATAVVNASSMLPSMHKGVIRASLDYLNDQSRAYIASLEQKLAIESEPRDARSLSERLLAAMASTSG